MFIFILFFVAIFTANSSYSCLVLVISLSKPTDDNKLEVTRLAKEFPLSVMIGRHDLRESLAVVCALQGYVSKNKSASFNLARCSECIILLVNNKRS